MFLYPDLTIFADIFNHILSIYKFQDKEAEESEKGKEKSLAKIQEQEEGSEEEDKDSMVTQSTTPMITSVQYNKYVLSLIKLLVGERTLNDWIRKGIMTHIALFLSATVHDC